MIVGCTLFIVSLFLFAVSIRSFQEKGLLLNNAYLFASPKERETMDKKPYYRQTGIVFFLLGIVFCLLGFAAFWDAVWLTYLAGALALVILLYAIASSMVMERRKKRR